jgi:type III secretory pathway component EscU
MQKKINKKRQKGHVTPKWKEIKLPFAVIILMCLVQNLSEDYWNNLTVIITNI